MVFIEASQFTRLVPRYLSEEDYSALQWYLKERPDSGDVISGSGGIRKVRWAASGKGKRGGVRVIYYWRRPNEEIWMLTIYSKRERATLPISLLRKIAEEINHG